MTTKAFTSTLKKITLNAKMYSASIKTALSYQNDIQQYPVEDGFSVADNIKHQPITIELEIVLGGAEITDGRSSFDEFTELQKLQESGVPFTFDSPFGGFLDMLITSLSPAQELTPNTFSCSVTISQVKFAKLTSKLFNVADKDGRPIYAAATPDGIPPTLGLEVKSTLLGDMMTAGSSAAAAINNFGVSSADYIIHASAYIFGNPF